MTKYSGAVLIIGSLLWDTEKETRANWQLNRLDLANKQTVYAPIRYGRLSEKRDYTYTMVFSQLCYRTDYGLGTAILVPFQHRIQTSRDLIEEASELWKAEADISTNRVLSASSSWGAVGLLARPNSQIPDTIIQDWSTHYRTTPRFRSTQSKTEKPVLDENGLLKLRWLVNADKNSPVEFDYILATATKPTLIDDRYPSAKIIADAWMKDKREGRDNIKYFKNNQLNKIKTFQDDLIREFLGSQEQ